MVGVPGGFTPRPPPIRCGGTDVRNEVRRDGAGLLSRRVIGAEGKSVVRRSVVAENLRCSGADLSNYGGETKKRARKVALA